MNQFERLIHDGLLLDIRYDIFELWYYQCRLEENETNELKYFYEEIIMVIKLHLKKILILFNERYKYIPDCISIMKEFKFKGRNNG